MEEVIIKYLFQGKTQQEISELLKQKSITPNSLSSIEKALKKLKLKHKANTLFHLAVILCQKSNRKVGSKSKTIPVPLESERLPLGKTDLQLPEDFKLEKEVGIISKGNILSHPKKQLP